MSLNYMFKKAVSVFLALVLIIQLPVFNLGSAAASFDMDEDDIQVYNIKNISDKYTTFGRTEVKTETVNAVQYGRLYLNNIGSGLEFSANCSGDVSLSFDVKSIGEDAFCGFDVYIDGVLQPKYSCYITETGNFDSTIATNLSNGTHTFKIIRYNDPSCGNIALSSINLCGTLNNAASSEPGLSFALLGDDIFTGYGINAKSDSTDTASILEDGLKSFGYLASKQMNANIDIVAARGIGAYTGAINYNMVDAFGYISKAYSSTIKLAETYDAIIINLGDNDVLNYNNNGVTIGAAKQGYIDFLSDLRASNPDAVIIVTYGMYTDLSVPYIESVISSVNNTDANIIGLRLDKNNDGEYGYPSLEAHEAAAESLVNVLNSNFDSSAAAPTITVNPSTPDDGEYYTDMPTASLSGAGLNTIYYKVWKDGLLEPSDYSVYSGDITFSDYGIYYIKTYGVDALGYSTQITSKTVKIKFKNRNLYTDGDFENLDTGTDVCSGAAVESNIATPNSDGYFKGTGALRTEVTSDYSSTGNHSLKVFNAWNNFARVIEVEPSTTYTFSFDYYFPGPLEGEESKKSNFGWLYLRLFGTAYTDDTYLVDGFNHNIRTNEDDIWNYPTSNTNALFREGPASAVYDTWIHKTYTVTTRADSHRLAINFLGEYRQFANQAMYIDNISFVKSSDVLSDIKGFTAENQEGVRLANSLISTTNLDSKLYIGAPISATAVESSYDAEFIGWYKDDQLLTEDLELKINYDGLNYVAKYQTNNLIIDGDLECYADALDPLANAVHIWGTGQNKIDFSNIDSYWSWSRSPYGRGYITTDMAHTGEKSLALTSPSSHTVLKIAYVKPNTDYVFSFYYYQEAKNFDITNTAIYGIQEDAKVIVCKNNHLIFDTNGGNNGGNNDATAYPAQHAVSTVCVTNNIGDNAVLNEWTKVEFTFNSGEFSRVALPFAHTGGEITYIDDIALYEASKGDGIELVVNTVGNSQAVGGVAAITYVYGHDYIGAKMNFSATPSNSSCEFLGWYSDNKLISSEQSFTDNLYISTIEARFRRLNKNLVSDGTFENYSNGTNLGGLYNWVGTSTNKVSFSNISANNWTQSAYGRGSVSNEKAHGGELSLKLTSPGHTMFKVVDVEANTDYVFSFWYYQDVAALTAGARNVYGIDPDATQVAIYNTNNIYTTNGGNNGGADSATAYSFQQPISSTTSGYGTTGAWSQATISFNSGIYERVIIPLYTTNAGAVYVDDLMLYISEMPEVEIQITGAGGNAGTAFILCDTFAEGAELTYKAVPNTDVADFIGWFKYGENEPVSTELSFKETYSILTSQTYIAKFHARCYNYIDDSNLEKYTVGDNILKNAKLNWITWPSGKVKRIGFTDIDTTNLWGMSAYASGVVSNAKAHSGERSIHPVQPGHTFYKIVDVEKNTDYVYSFWYYEDGYYVSDANGWGIYGIDPNATKLAIYNNHVLIATEGGTDGGLNEDQPYTYQHLLDKTVLTNNTGENAVLNKWTKVSIAFNSGNYERVILPFNSNSKYSVDDKAYYYDDFFVDDLTLIQGIVPSVTAETTGAGGMGGTAGFRTASGDFAGIGDEITYYANAYSEFASFAGWYYENEDLPISLDPEYTITYTGGELKPIIARFNSFMANSFSGLNADGLDLNTVFSFGTATNNIMNFDGTSPLWSVSSLASSWGAMTVSNDVAYDGEHSLKFKARNNSVGTKIENLQTNTFYSLSFYYYVPASADGYGSIYQASVTEPGYQYAGGTGATLDTGEEDANGKEVLKNIYITNNTVFGEWTKVTLNFNTKDNTEVWMHFKYDCSSIGEGDNEAYYFYLDNFRLFDEDVLYSGASIAMKNDVEDIGVAIRTDGIQALRFKSKISWSKLEAAALYDTYTVVEYGSLAMRKSYLGNNELTLDYVSSAGKKPSRGINYSADKGEHWIFAYNSSDIIFSAALTGITEEKYQIDYSLRVYCILERSDGERITVYDDQTRYANIYQVAEKAYEQGTEKAETLKYIYDNILSKVNPTKYPKA